MKNLKTLLIVLFIRGTSVLPTSNKHMVLFTNALDWNSASLICHVTGGSLLSVTKKEQSMMKDLLNNPPWKAELSLVSYLWLGLHVESGSEPAELYWDTCRNYTNDLEVVIILSHGNCAIMRSGIYERGTVTYEKCSKTYHYICEYIGGKCHFASLKDTQARDSDPFSLTTGDANGCTDACSSSLLNGSECWAATWHASTYSCSLHFTADENRYLDSANQNSAAGYTLYTKNCYSVAVDKSNYPGYGINSLDAIEKCTNTTNNQAIVYTLFTIPVNWTAAKQICGQLGYDLLVLDDSAENRGLNLLFGQSVSQFWTGISGVNGNFSWITGKPVTWNVWNSGEPVHSSVQTCGVTDTSTYVWSTANCGQKLPYICQMTNASCTYNTFKKSIGPTDNSKGNLKCDKCRTLCDGTTDCRGYSCKTSMFSSFCYIHVSANPWYLYEAQNVRSHSSYSLYKSMCRFGVTNKEQPIGYLPEPVITGNDVLKPLESSTLSTDSYLSSTEFLEPPLIEPSTSLTTASDSTFVTDFSDTAFYVQPSWNYVSEESGLLSDVTKPSRLTENLQTRTAVNTLQTAASSLEPSQSAESLQHVHATSTVYSAESLTASEFLFSSTRSSSVSYNSTAWTNASSYTEICPCRCIKNFSTEEVTQLLKDIQRTLLVEPSSTAKSVMAKKSADDRRPSAQTMGYAAISFLTLTFGAVLMLDITTLIHHASSAIHQLIHMKR